MSMLSKQKFSVVRRGYDTIEVDSYIHELETIVSKRNQELAAYREKEAAINSSLVDAKQMADHIRKEAEEDAADIRAKAGEDAAAMHDDAVKRMSDITTKVTAMRDKLDSFKRSYNQILQQYLIAARAKDMTALFDDMESFMKELGLQKEEEPVSLENLKEEPAPAKAPVKEIKEPSSRKDSIGINLDTLRLDLDR